MGAACANAQIVQWLVGGCGTSSWWLACTMALLWPTAKPRARSQFSKVERARWITRAVDGNGSGGMSIDREDAFDIRTRRFQSDIARYMQISSGAVDDDGERHPAPVPLA